MNHFCTITTADHLYKVYALHDSLVQHGSDVLLHVLVIDKGGQAIVSENIKTWRLADISAGDVAQQIAAKYHNQPDRLRWSMKPVFLHYLLQQPEISKTIYLDNDLFFFNGWKFLFDELDTASFLLTPHYYHRSPVKDQNWLEANYRAGLYNAGFVAVNKRAAGTLQWWAECCLYYCKKNAIRGSFDDQKYLDLVPVIQEDAKILRHQGCNVAEWNRFVCIRKLVNGQVLINDKWPVVFVHFTYSTIREITDGNEPLLAEHYNQYFEKLVKYKPGLTKASLYKPVAKLDWAKYFLWRGMNWLNI